MTSKPDPPNIVDRREENNQFDIDESEVSEAEEESKDDNNDNNDNRKKAKKERIILVQEEPDSQFSDAIRSPEMQPTRQSVNPPENNMSPTTATHSMERNATQTASRERRREEDRSNNDTSAIPAPRPGAQHIMGLGRSGWGSGVVDAEGDSHVDSARGISAINAPAGEASTWTTQGVPLIPEAVIAPDVGLIVQDAVQEALRQRDEEEALRRQSRRVVENEERAEIVQGVIVKNENEEEGAVWNWKLVTFLIFIFTLVTVIALAVALSSGKEENETQAPTQSPTKTLPPTAIVTERNESTFAVEAYMCEIPNIYLHYYLYEGADIPLDENSREYPPGVYFEEMEPEPYITSHEPFIHVCMRPNQKARDEGMTMRSIESFVFSRIHPNNVTQPAIVNGSPSSNDLTIPGPCFEVEGASQCFFETQLSRKLFDETTGRIRGLGSGTMQLISEMSNVTVISNFEMSFNVAGHDEPTTDSGAFLDNTVPGSMLLLGLIIGVASLILSPN